MNSPKHVAIIMDGNGRWGIKKKNSRNYGHKKGLEVVEKIIETAIDENIKYLTLFVIVDLIIFSTVFKPALCPKFLDFLFSIPHLPLPSMIMATCLGEFILSLFLFLLK